MSCGTKIDGRFHSWGEREDLADALEREGEWRIARAVRHRDCLDASDLTRAERALDRQNLSKRFDYREEDCRCQPEEGDDQ